VAKAYKRLQGYHIGTMAVEIDGASTLFDGVYNEFKKTILQTEKCTENKLEVWGKVSGDL
jgi:hypothetical protein